MAKGRVLRREGLNFVMALLMDLVMGDDIEVISSFLGPTPSLRRWGWALFLFRGGSAEGLGFSVAAPLLEQAPNGDKMGHGTFWTQRVSRRYAGRLRP